MHAALTIGKANEWNRAIKKLVNIHRSRLSNIDIVGKTHDETNLLVIGNDHAAKSAFVQFHMLLRVKCLLLRPPPCPPELGNRQEKG